MEAVRVILITAPNNDEASRLAQQLVERQLAACVNIVPGIRSIYRWEGRICDDAEAMLIVKTLQPLLGKVIDAIKELHSYQVPEVIALPVLAGNPAYLAWINDSVMSEQER